jgi:hypothetical protein
MYLKNDVTAEIGGFANYQPGWSPASAEDPPVPQAEIDAYLLEKAKLDKIKVLNEDFEAFRETGFEYNGNLFCLGAGGILNIAVVKNDVDPASPNKYKFANKNDVFVDFVDSAGLMAFCLAICTERDRIMVYKINKKKEINDCSTIAAVDAVAIDFSV